MTADYQNTPIKDIPPMLWLLVRCPCGHGQAERIWQAATDRRARMTPAQIQARLVCRHCKARSPAVNIATDAECGSLMPGASPTYNQVGRPETTKAPPAG